MSISQMAGFLNCSGDMFDVAKRREPRADKRGKRKELYREKDCSMERGSVGESRRERVGYRR
jgi:hypothetical protein